MESEKRPWVGIGVMIMNDEGKILLAQRKQSHGTGEYCFPGGHQRFGETIFESAKREIKEETSLDINAFEIISLADEMRYIESDGKHYVNIGVKGKYTGGEPKNMEPEKNTDWQWFSLDNLPENLFEGTEITLNNYKTGKMH